MYLKRYDRHVPSAVRAGPELREPEGSGGALDDIQRAQFICLNDGRRLAYSEFGQVHGYPLLYLHNHASSRLEGMFFHEYALAAGFRLIAVDRPGLGQSDFFSATGQSSFAEDLIQLANQLGLARFGVFAWGGGGPFALALAGLYPQRVQFVHSLACLPPPLTRTPSLSRDWLRRLTLRALRTLICVRCHLALHEPFHYLQRLKEGLCYADRKIMDKPHVLSLLMLDIHEARRQGYKGIALDTSLGFAEWEFLPEKVSVPVHIWQGTADTLVPTGTGSLLANRLKNCVLHQLRNQGHFFGLQSGEEIFRCARSQVQGSQSSAFSSVRQKPPATTVISLRRAAC